ncbi:MAG: T9SS type A sorting domain-containing protein [Saprospiraceae bacterium]
MQKIILLFLTLISFNCMNAQELISSELLGNISEAQLSFISPIPPNHGVDLYKVLYTTPDVQGVKDTASGLLCVPDVAGTFPLLAYQHGTVGGPEDVPSNRRGGFELAVFFASQSFVTSAADFLGLGEARGFHPYVHAATEASAAIDMAYAVQDFIEMEADYTLNEQLFITGYSQGGHASMAMHREIEQNLSDQFNIAAASHMSGPYSVSGVMRDLILSDEPYGTVAYLPNTVLGYQTAYGNIYNDLSEVFKEPYLTNIREFEAGTIELFELNDTLKTLLTEEVGATITKAMVQEDYMQALVDDPDHPANIALRDNDVFDWTPQAITRIYYCLADDQVPFRNSIVADSVMNANGALDVQAFNVGDNLDHGGCVIPAVTATLDVFLREQEFSTDVNDIADSEIARFYPNPASEQLFVEFKDNDFIRMQLEITDLSGKLQQRTVVESNGVAKLDIANLAEGIYLVKMITDAGFRTQKLVVQR